jgi:hypothetical protein
MLIGITPGRALRWGPRWLPAEHSVLFDASSGDYWVLAETTRQLLEALQREGRVQLSDVAARTGSSEEEGGELLAQLSRSGLLVGWVDGQVVGLAAFVDTAT